MAIIIIIVAVAFLACLLTCVWGVKFLASAFSVKVEESRQYKCLWCGLVLCFIGGIGLIYTGNSLFSLISDDSKIESFDEVAFSNGSGCVIDWGDLRVQGNYGAITVASRSEVAVEVWVSTNGMNFQANLEPNRGVRLRNGLKLPEKDETVWTVKMANVESRDFTFAQCMPLGCDLPPAAEL